MRQSFTLPTLGGIGLAARRFVKDDRLWGCLAAMSIQSRQLDTAEVALAALSEADKLEFIVSLKQLPSEEVSSGRGTTMAPLAGNT